MREADFSEHIKTVLCERVGGRCSNPACKKETMGPHRESNKRLSIGEAAHISAASSGGPRYDARLTKEERESADNGIWLCVNCHTMIDKNPEKYSIKELEKWKIRAEYEQECRQNGTETNLFYNSQRERTREALREIKKALDVLHDLLEYSYKYWEMNFSGFFSNPIDLQNEIDEHDFLYNDNLVEINGYHEKKEILCETMREYSLDIDIQVINLLNEYVQLMTFTYKSDAIGMMNNYWAVFFEMITKNIDNLRKLKSKIDDMLRMMYSN